MDKVGEDEEKTIEEASNSVEETRTHKEDERIRSTIADIVDPVDSTEEGSADPSYSHTVAFENFDFTESELEDEKVLEFFRRNNSVRPEVAAERNNFPYLYKPEGMMVLQFQEDTHAETEQTNVGVVNLNSVEIVEGFKSSSASDEDTEDSSTDSDLDSNLSRYYFDGSLPLSAHVEEEEFENHQDESPGPKDENKVPLLYPKQPMQQPTLWRNCCGLLQLLRAYNSGTIRNTDLQ